MNTGLQGIWNVAVISYFKVLPQHSFKGIVIEHKKTLASIDGFLAEI
jgi:hypothetical protein